MNSFIQRADYLLRSIVNFGQERKCPFCGSKDLRLSDRKYFFTTLLRCNVCSLEHRHPKDDEQWLKNFYQKKYKIDTHMMTQLPSDSELEKLKQTNFDSIRSNLDYITAVLKRESGLKIIDYGCSWGYEVYRLNKAGHHAVGYELSVPRGAFGKSKLGVNIYADTEDLPGENDLVISSHVIEHLSRIQDFISLSKKLLKEDGIFMAFCPNGSDVYKKREPHIWHINWGAVHPNSLTVEFAQYAFAENPYLILTADWNFDIKQVSDWDGKSQQTGSYQEGKELFIVARPNQKIK